VELEWATLSTPGTRADIDGNAVRPVWFEQYEFPLSKLEKIDSEFDRI
tara:strand:+ start:965 stop:1108 length:144 start_codon:yes stop_codon:yes gene_type:complete